MTGSTKVTGSAKVTTAEMASPKVPATAMSATTVAHSRSQ